MTPALKPALAVTGNLAAVKSSVIPDGTLSSADYAEANAQTPAHVVIKALLQPAKGSNIRVEIWLPDAEQWNGKFVGLGNGGAAGSINAGGFVGWVKNGYAVATTDMGTAPNDKSGVGNPEVWKDFGFRATHLMTTAAKQMIQAYYGKAPEYSYFKGGSTGGQQAMQEAQRYPEDYDAILANVPALSRAPLHAYFLWNYQITRNCPITKEQDKNIMAAAIEYMADRQIPQRAGKVIADPRCNEADIEAVIKLAREKDASLTDGHAAALRKIFTGPVNSAGERIFGGVPLGSSINDAVFHLYLFYWVFGAQKDLLTINFDADMDTYTQQLGPYLNAENPDLAAFQKRGGKLIMIAGSRDSIVPFHSMMDYYERCAAKTGSLEELRKFFLFYIVPGAGHGGGGDEFFQLLVKWREQGVQPSRVGEALYPYPEKTCYKEGAGFFPEPGPRGVAPIAERFLPAAGE